MTSPSRSEGWGSLFNLGGDYQTRSSLDRSLSWTALVYNARISLIPGKRVIDRAYS